MSEEAALKFGLSHDEFIEFLSEPPQAAFAVSETSKQLILIASIFLFVLAVLTCVITCAFWVCKKLNQKQGYAKVESDEKASLACDESALRGSSKGLPELPQLSANKPNLSNITFPETPSFDEDELRKLKVETIQLSSSYYPHRNMLQVNVGRIDLAQVNEKLLKNAYVYWIVNLTPEHSAFFESELRPCAEENYFEEACEFEIKEEDFETRTLKMSVYACDRFSQHRLVNQYVYELEKEAAEGASEEAKSIVPVELQLVQRSEDNEVLGGKMEPIGEVLFSLCYMPTSGRLTFVALKGKDLCDEGTAPLATYLRVSLLVSGKTMKTVQTSSVRRSSSPVYNEAFVFHTPLERFKDTDIIISVMTYDPSKTTSKMLGKIIVGPESDNNLGRKHWEAMLTSPRKPVAQWHPLAEFL